MEIRPITWKHASEYVNENHRHHQAPRGGKFCIGVYDGESLHGVAMCGRPVSRELDDGRTLEINRVCTDGTRNACSMLYGASCRVAKAMGYKRVVTYILESEDGASLKASNFQCASAKCGAIAWRGIRPTGKDGPPQMKSRWEYYL